jgi:hypothetical protein
MFKGLLIRMSTFINLPVLLAVLCTPAPTAQAGHSARLRWLVGKVSVQHNGRFSFQSSGFVFRHASRHYVITTSHTIEKIRNDYGHDAPIFIQLPNLGRPLSCTLLFTEPSEDSAVLEIKYPSTEGVPDTVYEPAPSLRKGERLAIIGYSDTTHRRHKPVMLFVDFLSEATLDFNTNLLSLPPDPDPGKIRVILTKGGSPHPGMSGGPVLAPDTLTLIGMTKSYGISRADGDIPKALGVEEFHIIVRLDRTMERIRNIR